MADSIERVLVVNADRVHSLLRNLGFLTDFPSDFLGMLRDKAFFMDRPDAEQDPSFRQVIPYTLVCHGGKFLTVTRHSTQGESRLHNLMSFGIGGHINPVDDEETDVLDSGLKRELSEELDTGNPPGLNDLGLLGLICSDANDVSRVHLGLVLRWDVENPVDIRETDKMHGEYLTVDEIGLHRDRLENWSRLVYDGLLKPVGSPITHDNS